MRLSINLKTEMLLNGFAIVLMAASIRVSPTAIAADASVNYCLAQGEGAMSARRKPRQSHRSEERCLRRDSRRWRVDAAAGGRDHDAGEPQGCVPAVSRSARPPGLREA